MPLSPPEADGDISVEQAITNRHARREYAPLPLTRQWLREYLHNPDRTENVNLFIEYAGNHYRFLTKLKHPMLYRLTQLPLARVLKFALESVKTDFKEA